MKVLELLENNDEWDTSKPEETEENLRRKLESVYHESDLLMKRVLGPLNRGYEQGLAWSIDLPSNEDPNKYNTYTFTTPETEFISGKEILMTHHIWVRKDQPNLNQLVNYFVKKQTYLLTQKRILNKKLSQLP